MPSLLMIAPAPVIVKGDRVLLDVKFAEGMEAQSAAWDGRLDCILWEGATHIPFPVEVDRRALPWGLTTLPAGSALPAGTGQSHDLVAAAGDMAETLSLAGPGRTPVVYTVEYTHRTRLDILALDRNIGVLRRLRRRLWLEQQERRRRSALRAAAAIQSNGYPCANAYADLNSDLHIYLDNRMTLDRYATPEEQERRRERLQSDAPIQLVYSGRLDPMKGAQDLVPVAARLSARGFKFRLDIFGDGTLRSDIASAITANNLADIVRLHGNVNFADELVPWQRRHADMFLSCHRQGDPSCTYIESMGCGLPVVGYENEMWGPLCRESGGGWSVPVGDVDALAARISTLTTQERVKAADAASAFARLHDFQTEFQGRMAHLAGVANRTRAERAS